MVFLVANEETLANRYGATRRPHPFLTEGESLTEAIKKERELISPVEWEADVVIDTSGLSPHQLARHIEARYLGEVPPRSLYVTITSFGFKHGQLRPADSIFDVRFLNNPYFVPSLKKLSGLDEPVKHFIREDQKTEVYLQKIIDLNCWLLPQYYAEGKHYFRIGIGCTGGQHRSVFIAETLCQALKDKNLAHLQYSVHHRDVQPPR